MRDTQYLSVIRAINEERVLEILEYDSSVLTVGIAVCIFLCFGLGIYALQRAIMTNKLVGATDSIRIFFRKTFAPLVRIFQRDHVDHVIPITNGEILPEDSATRRAPDFIETTLGTLVCFCMLVSGAGSGLYAFFSVWIWCFHKFGFVFGGLLGWLPALPLALLASLIATALTPLLLLAAATFGTFWAIRHFRQ